MKVALRAGGKRQISINGSGIIEYPHVKKGENLILPSHHLQYQFLVNFNLNVNKNL